MFKKRWNFSYNFLTFFDKVMTKRKYFDKTTVFLTVCSYHVTYTFQSESTLRGCLSVKELLAQSRGEIWSLGDCNWTRTHNDLVHKRTLNHLDKLAKWFSVRFWTKSLWVWVQLQSLKVFFLSKMLYKVNCVQHIV